MIKLIVRNIKAGILFIYILSRLIFADISFSLIYFPGYKFCHISCGFIFINGEILIIWGGRVFMVTRYNVYVRYGNTVEKANFCKVCQRCTKDVLKVTKDVLTETV